ncbi:hypothetical protein BgAZ_305390 [Babesia gibsoni]|uniref:Uncharacterized protein n=1 Tax=Babesia gibsoni TaxID=33632 RepID=A0AAD8LQH5_BABGI|nr:hypothetical protein BgAZ_305390 [Babesia gibsoni]
MFFIIPFLLFAVSVECSLRPASATFGVLQTPPPANGGSKYRFAGVYVPGYGVYWHAQKPSILNGIKSGLKNLRDSMRFQDTKPITDDIPADFMYRILVVNKLNAIKNAAKRGLVSLEVDGDKLTVKRTGIIRRILTNSY